MNIKESCRNNKLSLVALHKFVQESASELGVILGGSLAEICEQAGINRPQVYERKAQLEAVFQRIELSGPGRPANSGPGKTSENLAQRGWEVRERVLKHRLAHPGAMVEHETGRVTYSDPFIRFILDQSDEWPGSPEQFCQSAEIAYSTYRSWRKRDKEQPFAERKTRCVPPLPVSPSKTFWQIAADFVAWEGGIRDFFKYETTQLDLGPTPIRRVLTICNLLPQQKGKEPRYRGATEQLQPGSILVTDGKAVEVLCTSSGEMISYNWQGIVDQATTCHTAVIVTATESAKGVRESFDNSKDFMGRPPMALVHDNKPIHDDKQLREHIEKTTTMIPATPNRGQNKAGIEGEFGKFEQTVGTIQLDDRSRSSFLHSAVREILRAYTAGVNHAGRVELDGKSRHAVLRETCPDPEKDRKFIETLHEDHTKKSRRDILKTQPVSRALLDKAFGRFGLDHLDPDGSLRQWLAARYMPEAIRQAAAIFGTEYDKGRLHNKTAHRYLVKVIQNCQHELDLRRQEELLREFAEKERSAWLLELNAEHDALVQELGNSLEANELLFRLCDNAVFGGMALQRAFWEDKLKDLLSKQRDAFAVACRHVRRIFEATWENRFSLISKMVAWENLLFC